MPDTFHSAPLSKPPIALAAACLSAVLVTAFAEPSHAIAVTPTPTNFQTSTGVQIDDGYVLETSNFFDNTTTAGTVSTTFPDGISPFSVTGSQPASSPGLDNVVVFTQSPNGSGLAGENFSDAFLSGTAFTEQEVATYIGSGFNDTNVNDIGAYNTFVASLTNNYGSANSASDPVNAYEFTGGQPIGTVSQSQLSLSGGSSPYTGFGLTANATSIPEAGSLPMLVFGGAMLAGITVARRRRQEV